MTQRMVSSTDQLGGVRNVSARELEWRPSVYSIVIDNGKILLSKQFGKYNLPGGAVELGETLEEAVVRETLEETGFVVERPRLTDFQNSFFTWKGEDQEWHYQSMLFFYTCDLVDGTASALGMEDGEALEGEMPEWIALGDLENIPRGSTFDWLAIVRRTTK